MNFIISQRSTKNNVFKKSLNTTYELRFFKKCLYVPPRKQLFQNIYTLFRSKHYVFGPYFFKNV